LRKAFCSPPVSQIISNSLHKVVNNSCSVILLVVQLMVIKTAS
jgi:hypothetical protein